MSEHTLLRLKSDVTLVEQGTLAGLCLGQKTTWARDGTQAKILHALSHHPLDLDALCGNDGQPIGDTQTALALASLILEFGDYLEP